MKAIRTTTMLLVAVLMLGTSCGGGLVNPSTKTLSTEGKLAVGGRQVIAALDQAATGVDVLVQNQILLQAEAVKVLVVIREMGVQGQNLAVALKAVDEAKDAAARQVGLQQAASILKAMQRGVMNATVPVSTEAGRQRVSTVMGIVADALVSLALMLPPATQALPVAA
jgi:hypothetical protein